MTTTATKFFLVVKGSKDLGIAKGQRVQIVDVEPMGADVNHAAKVRIMVAGKTRTLWVAHPNRLLDPEFNLSLGADKVRLAA